MADGLLELVGRLRTAGIDPSSRELAEALWLARYAGPASPPAQLRREPDGLAASTGGGPGRPADTGTARHTGDRPAPRPAPAPSDGTVPLHVSGARDRRPAQSGEPAREGVPVSAPVAAALPALLPLQRALRPLQRYAPPVHAARPELDEQATAERAAETGVVIPVLRSTPRHSARVQLLMDVSSSMAPWEEMCAELRQVCVGSGAFRDVKVHFLHEDAVTGAPVVGGGTDPGGGTRPAGVLCDPTGQWITLLLSDCAGPMWRSGRLQRQLSRWAATGPVAVVQPLPQRMWHRTHLPAVPGALRRRQAYGGQLDFRPSRGRAAVSGSLPVPVLAPTRTALGSWSRLVAGASGVAVNAAAGWVRGDHEPSRAAAPRREAEPEKLLAAFENSASPDALQLAVHLSSTLLSLPVMQLVQRAMLPHTGPSELSEVLLSGLLTRGERLAGSPVYEFRDGVRDLLLERTSAADAALVLKQCSRYVERNFGRRSRNFPAMAAAYLAGTADSAAARSRGARDAQPFARVSQAVLGRFLPADRPQPAPGGDDWNAAYRSARWYLKRHRESRAARDLDEAVRRFRTLHTAGRPGSPEARATSGPLADALLRRWRAAGAASDLEAAHRVAAGETADWPDGTQPRERARAFGALASVYAELAGAARDMEDWQDLPVLTGLVAAPPAGDEEHLRLRTVDRLWSRAAEAAARSGAGVQGALRAARLHAERAGSAAESVAPGPSSAALRDRAQDLYGEALAEAAAALTPARESVARAARGRYRLALARLHAGDGPFGDRRTDHERSTGHARDALADLEAAGPPEEGADAGYWLDRSEARLRTSAGLRDDDVFARTCHEARRGLEEADADDEELLVRAGTLISRILRERWRAVPESAGELAEEAVTALRLARSRLAGREEPYAGLLYEEAYVHMELATHPDRSATALSSAVALLRDSVECTAEPGRLAARRLVLAGTLRRRYAELKRQADLLEAEAVYTDITRDPDSAGALQRSRAWAALGQLAAEHSTRGSALSSRSHALSCYQRAADAALEDGGSRTLASRQLLAKAALLREHFGERHALPVYRGIAALWEDAGRPEHPDAVHARGRCRELEETGT